VFKVEELELKLKSKLMKQFLIFLVAGFITATTFAQVGINTQFPDASAALDITSTTQGLLLPRMTAAQRTVITSPSQGLIIFCTDCASGEGELQIKLTSSWKNLQNGDVNDPIQDPPELGDFYQGGVVYYIFTSTDFGYVAGETHGLIAAVENQNFSIRWNNGSNVTTEATATAVGTGYENTDAIIGAQGSTATSYAAGVARAYEGGGYTDWSLPSKDELSHMYFQKTMINTTASDNGGSDLSNALYWCSTENTLDHARFKNLSNNSGGTMHKSSALNVRAVRRF
jgi:hypothetical protein